jgi:hypothetical protein
MMPQISAQYGNKSAHAGQNKHAFSAKNFATVVGGDLHVVPGKRRAWAKRHLSP